MRWISHGIAVVSLSGCFHAWFYTGQGQFTDNGVLAYSRRYVIDLGPVDLSVPRAYTYRLSGLPHAQFNVAIHIVEEKQNQWDVRPKHPATVRIHLETSDHETVILEERPLDSWTRGYGVLNNISELYLQGKTREVPLPEGGMRHQKLGVKASGGWGSYFDSERDKSYILKLEVLASTMNRPARLMVVGWDRS